MEIITEQGNEPISPDEQKTSTEMLTAYINSHIKKTPKEQQYIVVDITPLYLSMSMDWDEFCEIFIKAGWYIKYAPFFSFIWRHKFILSKKHITEYLPHTNKFQCCFHKNQSEATFAKRQAENFMEQNRKEAKENPKKWHQKVSDIIFGKHDTN